MMKHSAVNGLVSEDTVRQMYDMIIENARKYLDLPATVDARALQKGKDRKNRKNKLLEKARMSMHVMIVDQLSIG